MRVWLGVVLVVLGPVLGGLWRVWVYQDAVRLGYHLSEAIKERDQLDARYRELQVQRAAVLSPANIKRMASTLGMKPPDREDEWSWAP